MKSIKSLLLASALLLPSIGLADLTPSAFLKLSSGNETELGMVEMYVGGVVKGYLSANAFLGATNQQPMFCYDGDIDTGTAKKITTQMLKAHLKKAPEDKNKEIVEVLLLLNLKAKYPC